VSPGGCSSPLGNSSKTQKIGFEGLCRVAARDVPPNSSSLRSLELGQTSVSFGDHA